MNGNARSLPQWTPARPKRQTSRANNRTFIAEAFCCMFGGDFCVRCSPLSRLERPLGASTTVNFLPPMARAAMELNL